MKSSTTRSGSGWPSATAPETSTPAATAVTSKRPRLPTTKAQLGCSVDCEGGGISVELAGDSKSTKIRLGTICIWRNNKPDEDGFSLSGGADDRVFRLDRARLEQCRSLVTDRKELAALRRK